MCVHIGVIHGRNCDRNLKPETLNKSDSLDKLSGKICGAIEWLKILHSVPSNLGLFPLFILEPYLELEIIRNEVPRDMQM
jgi:hypothetical protein